jgi:hypothetical protein
MQVSWFASALLCGEENLIGNSFICEADYSHPCLLPKLAWPLQEILSRTFEPICERALSSE